MRNFAVIARPLTDFLRVKSEWRWSDKQSEAFRILKEKLVERPVMALYDARLDMELHTDASKLGIAGILMQRDIEGTVRPVAEKRRMMSRDYTRLI